MADFAALTSYHFKVPQGGDKVYKDECMYCFDSPYSEGGLYVCLSTLFSACNKHLKNHVEKTGNNIFLHLKKMEKEIIKPQEGSPPEKKPTKLAIGVEGGFDLEKNKIEYEDVNSLVMTDNNGIVTQQHLLPEPNLPLNVQLCIAAVLTHQGANLQNEVSAWEDKRIVSKHAANLLQLDNGVKVPPTGWKCAMCDLTENLWLNLTDGTILCGRRYFDGSGGNNHALEYYNQTKYPLAVKLGTISAEGGDVYSYDEDDMVEDPNLTQHLLHFGINTSVLEKTDKTMTELEIEANMSLKAEWDTIQEAGEKLTPLFGAGYTGMVNLGNSCYMNSLMQTLFSMDEFRTRYADEANNLLTSSISHDPSQDFNLQMAKLGKGLLSGAYSTTPQADGEALGVRPQMIKHLIGQGHPEFSTNHQQDVQEYFIHLMDVIEKNETPTDEPMQQLFKFQFEDRIECGSSGKVNYKRRDEMIWALPIHLDAATNIFEYQQFEQLRVQCEKDKTMIVPDNIVRLQIPVQACLDCFFSPDTVDDFYSSAIKGKTTARRMTRFATFPDYLIIQLQKFTISDDWTPKKLDVMVDMMATLDLTPYLSIGLQAHEEALPEESEPGAAPAPEINDEFVNMLTDMGFPREACKKAVYHTNNQGVEAAMNWVFEHSQDADFAAPLQVPNQQQQQQQQTFQADAEGLAMIMSLGFTEAQAKKALKKTNNNVEAAGEWIFTHGDELDAPDPDEGGTGGQGSSTPTFRHGDGKYQLFAFISHMGTSTSCGHYVAHIIKDGRWVIFNDRKVAASVNPPKDLGYFYFYKRISPPTT